MGAISAGGGWFGPGDDLERAWDEAEAILLASEDLDSVMDVIQEAESPVEARRALKLGFGFTGRQAALLLTLPVMSFTRSERQRLADGRRARMELLADVTGVLPAVREAVPGAEPTPPRTTRPVAEPTAEPRSEPRSEPTAPAATQPASAPVSDFTPSDDVSRAPQWDSGPSANWSTDFGAAFDGVLAGISSAMEEPEIVVPPLLSAPLEPEQAPPGQESLGQESPGPAGRAVTVEPRPPVAPAWAGEEALARLESARPTRRSLTGREEASAVLDEQIGELCDAIARAIGVTPPTGAWSDDPRSSADTSGALLDSCGVDDRTGIRTLLWHLRRTGLDAVEGLFPFAEPLTATQGAEVQAFQFDSAVSGGGLRSVPGSDVRWASYLWPIAERRGFGYAVAFGEVPDAGAVWAYGGDEPLHRLWDSLVDLLVELYQSVTTGSSCDAAVAAVLDGRVVWTNLS